jgi:hypothetical protein
VSDLTDKLRNCAMYDVGADPATYDALVEAAAAIDRLEAEVARLTPKAPTDAELQAREWDGSGYFGAR